MPKTKKDETQQKQTSDDTNSKLTSSQDDSGSNKGVDETPSFYDGSSSNLQDRDDHTRKTNRPVNVRVSVRQGESVEQMLRRFNYAANKADVIKRIKDNQFFEKPSKRRQREEKMRQKQIRMYEK